MTNKKIPVGVGLGKGATGRAYSKLNAMERIDRQNARIATYRAKMKKARKGASTK